MLYAAEGGAWHLSVSGKEQTMNGPSESSLIYRKVIAYMQTTGQICLQEQNNPEAQTAFPGILAGVSGGADSMVMLHILTRCSRENGFELRVLHVNHGIRGAEADRDEALVHDWCTEEGIPFMSVRMNVPRLSRSLGMGEEMTGRFVRRRALEDAAEGSRIALAHNQEDLAETVIQHLCRGSSLRGMTGIRPVSGAYIRPLLCLSRREILSYAESEGILFHTDSTNLEDGYTRNRIRHHVMPLLDAEVHEKAALHIARTASLMAQAEDYLHDQGRKALENAGVYFEKPDGRKGILLQTKLKEEPQIIQTYAVRCALENLLERQEDIHSVHIEETLGLFKAGRGKEICLPGRLRAARTGQGVELAPEAEKGKVNPEDKGFPEIVFHPSQAPLDLVTPWGCFRIRTFPWTGGIIEEKQYTKWFDYDKINDMLCIRTRKPSDYLVLDGAGHIKALRRVFIDDKIPREKRDKLPLLAQDREILWLAGGRMGAGCRVSERTVTIMEVTFVPGTGADQDWTD